MLPPFSRLLGFSAFFFFQLFLAHCSPAVSPICVPRPAGCRGRSREETVKFPLRGREAEWNRERESERGNGKEKELLTDRKWGGGLPLASATVFSTSAADYKQKKKRKKRGLALCKQRRGEKRHWGKEFLFGPVINIYQTPCCCLMRHMLAYSRFHVHLLIAFAERDRYFEMKPNAKQNNATADFKETLGHTGVASPLICMQGGLKEEENG